MIEIADSNLIETEPCSTDAAFSLVCSECDAGSQAETYEQTAAEGWGDIDYAPDLPMANYTGLCPECQETIARWPTTTADNESW